MVITKERERSKAYLRKLCQPLYDTNELDASTTNQLKRFFVRPQGRTLPISGNTKTEADTNMTSASSLPSPWHFEIKGFVFEFFVLEPDDLANTVQDTVLVYGQGVFRYIFNDRTDLEVPIRQIPSGVMLTGSAATGDITNDVEFGYLHWGEPSVDECYDFTIDGQMPQIPKQASFRCELDYPNGAIDPNTANDQRVRVFIKGILHRSL